ncbi:hypothetical protein CDL15_Pgr011010 [Punica granatum]|uniref:Uncharacterized protein n=1 Tax=Punica granatum TaxID=22663 RepID=A0A218XND2_PUNGR|nr:hypothetical protein CDL15_Pgr011010 [Punica granatum]
MVVDDVQMGRSEERQHSLRNNSQTRDRQREHLRPRDCFELAELVVSSNAEVEDMTCRRVSFGACTKRKLRKPGTPKESKGGLDWNGTHASREDLVDLFPPQLVVLVCTRYQVDILLQPSVKCLR